jgi:hypothetical protein
MERRGITIAAAAALATVLTGIVLVCVAQAIDYGSGRRPALDSVIIDCQYDFEGKPPCQLSVTGDKISTLTVRFERVRRTLRNLPQAPGNVHEIIPVYAWWRKAPDINYHGWSSKRCIRIDLVASGDTGTRRGFAEVCSPETITRIQK